MIIHYDTETTGLPVAGVPSEDPRHPHIVSLSAILDDDSGETRRVLSVIVRPNGKYRLEDFPEAQRVHGITTEVAERFGVSLEETMQEFESMVMNADILSAFNHHFDHKLIKIACARLPNDGQITGDILRKLIASKSSICTMEAAAQALTGKTRISLKNAYADLFKEENRHAHKSLGDAYASRRIYYELKARGVLPAPKSLAEREYATPYVAAGVVA